MRARLLAVLAPSTLLLLTLLPSAAGSAPVSGTVTSCSSTTNCGFTFNSSTASGWASTTSQRLSFQLPGEARASYNLTYSTYVQLLTGYYTYWTVGNFVGTDVNTGKVVYGTTNTNFTITAHCQRGCTYTYTTDNGTIVFHLTKAQQTSTAVSCNPSSLVVGNRTKCTVTLTNLWNSSFVPTGKVRLSSSSAGAFANRGLCTLASGSCSLTWTPADNTVGTVTITASYAGNATFYKSVGTTTVGVIGGG